MSSPTGCRTTTIKCNVPLIPDQHQGEGVEERKVGGHLCKCRQSLTRLSKATPQPESTKSVLIHRHQVRSCMAGKYLGLPGGQHSEVSILGQVNTGAS